MHTRWNGRMTAIAVVTVLALVASGCGGGGDGGGDEAAPPPAAERVERVRLAGFLGGYPSPFAVNQIGNAQSFMHLLFDGLTWIDAGGTVIPWLATGWEVSPDGLEWRFTLRDDVKWPDGKPLTADDVVFTYEYSASGPGRTGSLNYNSYAANGVTSVAAEGAGTVVFRTDRPDASFVKLPAVTTPIVPKHVWQSVTEPVKFRDPTALAGSGPYRLESLDEAQGTYLLVAKEDHWRGAPYVKRIEFVPAPDELLALRRGDIDVANLTNSTVTEEVLDTFDEAKYGRVSANGQTDVLVMIGMHKGFPYDDVRFRQALAYAVDRQDMVDRLLLGRGKPASFGMIEPPDGRWSPEDLPTYDHDPAKAGALLDEMGLKMGGDGVRHLPDGKPFKPEVLTSAPSVSPATAQVLQEQLRQVGIEVTVTSLDRTALNAATTKGNYELALMMYGVAWDPEIVRNNLSSRATPTWWRVQGWDNQRFEELLDVQRGQFDTDERMETSRRLVRIVADEVPILALVTPDRTALFDKTVMDTWHYTLGGGPVYPFLVNKLTFVDSESAGA